MKLKNKIIENRVGLLVTIGILLIVTIIVGISYAYFGNIEKRLNNTVSGNIVTNSYIFTTNGTGAISLSLNNDDLDVANASNDYSSYVSNTGGNINVSLDANGLKKVYCSYDLVYVPSTAYTPSAGATNAGLKEFTLIGTSNKGNSFSEIDVSGSSNITLISGVEISTDTTVSEEWNFTVKYYNLDVIQDNVIGKTFGGSIKVANTDCSFSNPNDTLGGDYVLLKSTGSVSLNTAKNKIVKKGIPDFSMPATENEGMYAAEDDLGTSYYFRGAVDNNWVKYGKYTKDTYYTYDDDWNYTLVDSCNDLAKCDKIASKGADIYWRIIRINGDGSIRMIYSGVTPPTESTKVIQTADTSLGYSKFNKNYNSAEYVGYMYTIGQQHGTSQSSDIKTYLEDWYSNYTNLNVTGTKITDQIYCNDRTASTDSSGTPGEISSWASTGTYYEYGASGRITNDNPMLTCAVDRDRFTVNKINGKGNSALTYPIGLITIDEVEMAGNNSINGNNVYYLHTWAPYWPGSPGGFDVDGGALGFYVRESGDLIGNGVTGTGGVRGVVSLSSKAKLSGSGTYDDIYTVVE